MAAMLEYNTKEYVINSMVRSIKRRGWLKLSAISREIDCKPRIVYAFRRTNFIEWTAYVLLLTETINENSTSWAKALCRDYLTSSDESTSLETSNFPLSFQVIKQLIHFVYLGFSIASCVFFSFKNDENFPGP